MKTAIFSLSAIHALLRDKHNLSPDTHIVIARERKAKQTVKKTLDIPQFWHDLSDIQRQGLKNIEIFLSTPSRDLIKAIKELRPVAGYGLYEAKQAIENWPDFVNACRRLNRWPNLRYDNGIHFS